MFKKTRSLKPVISVDDEGWEKKLIGLATVAGFSILSALFLLSDLHNGTPLPNFSLVAFPISLLLIVLIARYGMRPLVLRTFIVAICLCLIASLLLPGSRKIYVLVFFSAIPIMYALGGVNSGRMGSVCFLLTIAALLAWKILGLSPRWNIVAPLNSRVMAAFSLVAQILFSEVLERRHARHLAYITRQRFFDLKSGLPNSNTLIAMRLEAGETLLAVRIDNTIELSALLGMKAVIDAAVSIVGELEAELRRGERQTYYLADSELAVILPAGIDPNVACDRLLVLFDETAAAPGSALRLSPRVGCYRVGEDGDSAAEALEEARCALADSVSGGSRLAIRDHSDPDDDIVGKAPLILRNIERESLMAVYQPVYGAAADGISFIEALVRFEHDGAYISPEPYLDTAYRLGLGYQISDFMLCQAVEAAKESGHSVSLNLTYRDIVRRSFVERLTAECSRFAGGRNALIVELTEHDAFADTTRLHAFVDSVHEAGGLVFLDDFGSGYSNYTCLASFRLDGIKIAGEIAKEIAERKDSEILVEGIVAFCAACGIGVVAEHISDERIMTKALSLGAGYLQGYLFSPPVGLEDVIAGRYAFPPGTSSTPTPLHPARAEGELMSGDEER
jgi:EAL domain-containing protein (putative c-di-GMP-specific phosphodiesterase class I)